jgi:hypothetical protein
MCMNSNSEAGLFISWNRKGFRGKEKSGMLPYLETEAEFIGSNPGIICQCRAMQTHSPCLKNGM